MAVCAVRFITFVAILSLPRSSLPQQSRTLLQNPLSFRTNFLRDFMVLREEIFPFSFSTPPAGFFPLAQRPASLPPPQAKHAPTSLPSQPSRFSSLTHFKNRSQPLESAPSNVVKRRIPGPSLENESFTNNILQLHGNRSGNILNIPLNTKTIEAFRKASVEEANVTLKPFSNVFRPENTNLLDLQDAYPLFRGKSNLTKRPLNAYNSNHNTSTGLEDDTSKTSFLGYFISTLTSLPIIGNVLRASVDPLYRPIVNRLQPDTETIMRGESDLKNWCFGELGCIQPSQDFFHPLYRPVNLPPYSRWQIATIYTVHSQSDKKGYSFSALDLDEISYSSFNASRPTKIIIHGYLNDRHQTWILEMVRGLLNHGDYNVITVDWSGGAHALYSQATANIRVVALELVAFLVWAEKNFELDLAYVHIIGHSLGAHMAGFRNLNDVQYHRNSINFRIKGYVGEKLQRVGRITGLDPAEPFFQYMPTSVRLDPSDAAFVDVIHTDTHSFFALSGPRGFGLQQAVGHIDFYPNGGKDQPGCNQLLARVPMTFMIEGEDVIEGINAAQTELINCDHIRAPKLFTDSLQSECPYLSFSCASYSKYKRGKCFKCGSHGQNCAFMGINAKLWSPGNRTNVRMFVDTHVAPNFCKYHYILTINFGDAAKAEGTLRGRLKLSFIGKDGSHKKFDLTPRSPLKFQRTGPKSFMLEHFEDLSKSREAMFEWTFESDLLDPMTFCVLFCKADLVISTVSLLSIDTPRAASKYMQMRSGLIEGFSNEILNGGEIVLCDKDGKSSFKIPNESTMKITVSPHCHDIRKRTEEVVRTDSLSTKLAKVALSYVNG